MNKLFLIFITAFVFISLISFTSAAIAFDSSANGFIANAGGGLTYSHTVSGTNTILFVGISLETTSNATVDVSYNGASMTLVDWQTGNGESAYMYYLINPSTGTHNVAITFTGYNSAARSVSTSYTGAKQSAQPDASTKQTTAVTNPITTALNTVADNSWMVSYAQSNGFVVSAGTGTTLRNQVTDKFNAIGDSNSPITPPASYSMAWSGGSVWNIVQASFSPAITQALNITLVSPQSGSVIGINPVNSINFTGVYNLSTLAYNLSNATTYVWYNNGTLFNATTVNISNSTNNSTRVLINNFQVNSYLWNVNVCYGNNTFVNCSFAPSNYSFQTSNYTLNAVSFNNFTYETKNELFYINITAPSIPTNAQFVYNSTTYSANITNTSGGNFTISSIIDIPIGQGANNFYFNFMLGNNMATTNTYVQNVTNTTLFLCQGGALPYINYTFYDELTQLQITGSIAASTFNYWLGSGTVIKNLNYFNTTTANYYTFCLTPQNISLNMNYSITYQNPTYLARTMINSTSIFTNSTTIQNLYLLPTSSGQLVTFQVVNPAQQPISGVSGTATRNINGVNTIIGTGISGSDGGISFFVDPLLTYTFSFSKIGYSSFVFTTAPSQTSYTITLGANTQSNNDYTRGITYTILPSLDIINNNTVYNFNYTINSTFWTLNSFNYSIFGNSTVFILSNSSTSPTGGMINDNVNTSNFTSITMSYSYTINGTTINGNITWYVSNIQNDQYSIGHLFSDISSYAASGMFGSTNWAIGLITFLVIFITVGIMSYRYGFNTRANLIAVLCGLVVLFDVGLNFDVYMNPLVGAVPYLPSVLMLVMAISTIVREETR